jgi:hypothetical protein
VIQRRINTVYANGIDAELLKEREISRAGSSVSEGVNEAGRLSKRVVSGGNDDTLLLVRNAFDVEPVARRII